MREDASLMSSQQVVAPAINQLSLAPLGAGDLIDRAVRLYRRHFMTFIRASVPPVAVSALGSVLHTIAINALPFTQSGFWLVVYTASALLGWLLVAAGYLLLFVVMGGATHNLVRHLLWNEPVAARTIYRNVRARFASLTGATLAVVFCVVLAAGVAALVLFLYLLIFLLLVGLSETETNAETPALILWLVRALFVVSSVATLFGVQWLFFALAGRVAYVPQVLLVEGKGVMDAIGRSAQMARGNVRRLMAMSWFITFGGLAMLALLVLPLGWYAYLHGINLDWLRNAEKPVWYVISYQLMVQASTILLMPVWMLGLSLLYVDERVRREGYDVELLAARAFGEMPDLPAGRLSPLAPAIVAAETKRTTDTTPATTRLEKSPRHSMLGLNDR